MTTALVQRASMALFLLLLLESIAPGPAHCAPTDRGDSGPLLAAGGSDNVLRIEFRNGIAATIYPSDYLERKISYSDGRALLVTDAGWQFALITDMDDPAIVNKGDGEFHPFQVAHLLQALGEIAYPQAHLELDIYMLPYPRRERLESTTSGTTIFLSPHVRELSYQGAAYIVTHEVGHAFQNSHLPRRDEARWDEYKVLRGIDDPVLFADTAPHAYRPQEIFAEDFRVLFGGIAARYDGRVENPLLPSPLEVDGLRDFFLTLGSLSPLPLAGLEVSNYPNPFNPATEISVRLSSADPAASLSMRIYDAGGRLVWESARLIPGGGSVRVTWDGRDSHGNRVGSGVYFCKVRAGGYEATRKLMLVK